MGGDIGGAIKNFKSSVKNEEASSTADADKSEDKHKDS
ncbi:UNVERIFIED_CONTAM: hypothetical protein GTU68_059941 [Idotea baltica]|nr:hypothetical protein [Idotea baltica]